MNELATSLISAVVGGVIAVFADPLNRWFIHPKLKFEFDGTRQDCRVETPIRRKNRKGEVTLDTEGIVIRARVNNTGRLTAKSCCVWLTDIEMQDEVTREFLPTIYRDSLPLQWSLCPNRDDKYDAEIAPGMGQYVDIIKVHKDEKPFYLRVESAPYRYNKLRLTPGIFRLTIAVAGDRCGPVTTRIIFDWKRQIWDEIKAYAG